ncbi:enoyl-CoA hydratase domain-containing protein 3, mitochondrial isoform X2 [Osmia bicornis bicornis]|uniref:enoyl-CoA hydratase domain-containing protein 3, mitochondrial isoform X2 n=1 Tax=Osmia bicornis bicornis TaxID=1437191 RepID=UPI0010F95940|nr:enoyl-CoA hydratase domain-containing protein 3, mitochondrial isoform X2 [Osmia bicornis bicornis]XP_029040680.1 enoyl-CoA hydratase domain-containing protein 3, mitochondrial isoform X2 [Osmia bicornis bicornis]XP_046144206.1 enoyl-CoA hydratase domain-containing protein 3, mitochondrial isoform X2 [Osmia bicornis bicornis]
MTTLEKVGKYVIRTFSTNKVLSSEEKYVQVKEDNGIRIISLNHPSSRNSLSLKMMNSLLLNIKKDENTKDLRSIILKSELPNMFSAGHNLKELTSNNGKHHKDIFETCSELMKAITQSPVPVIAAVDGVAVAAGCQLVTACDIAICTERSSFATPGANFGIFCSTPGIPLVRNVSKKTAMYMLFTGLSLNGKEAYEVGLVSKVVPIEKFEQEIEKITAAINAKSRSVVHVGKTFLYEQLDLDLATAYFLGAEKMVNNLKMKDAQEGIRSFIEKRKPVWSHDYEKTNTH